MPIYAYRCEACGFAKDVLQKMSDDPLTECPACHKQTFQKQVTAAGFQLKGSGWYVTDFRNGQNGGASSASSSGESSGNSNGGNGGSSGSKGESTSVPKTSETAVGTTKTAVASAPASSGTPAPSADKG